MLFFTEIYFYLLIVFGIIYVALILFYTLGWFRLKTFNPQNTKFKTRVSIIIPARNEEENITNLLTDLAHQAYPKNLFEVIVIDDNSTDTTHEKVSNFIKNSNEKNFNLIGISEESPDTAYKKKAINLAIEKSNGDLIITTDADCRMGMNWLSSFVTLYETEKPKMIVGPVSFFNETTFFQKMQTLEFLSLIAITGGAIKAGRPIMCNGANLAYEKGAFIEVGGFGSDSFASGDDVFLLLRMKKQFGNKSVRFLKNNNAIVYTEALKSVADFFHQRTRWASKNKVYDVKILFVSFSVYMTNLILFTGLIQSIFIPSMLPPVMLAFVIKLLVELPILIGIGNFVKRSRMFLYSFPLIFIYPLYIIVVGALGILGNYHWKGRKVKQ
ncbi:MAG: glycosyltransferase [Bacteroidales bacterium]